MVVAEVAEVQATALVNSEPPGSPFKDLAGDDAVALGVNQTVSTTRAWHVYGIVLASTMPMRSRLLPASLEPDHHAVTLRFDRIGLEEQLPSDGGKCARVIRMPGPLSFHLWPRRIVARADGGVDDAWVEVHLLGTVLATWLEWQGVIALHASAVVLGERAVAFLASNRGGKSALAAQFMLAGHPLLSDDILPIDWRDGKPIARPGYPQMRMWPDNAAHFLGPGYLEMDVVHAHYPKLRIPVGMAGFGRFSAQAVQFGALILPLRGEDALRSVRADMSLRRSESFPPVEPTLSRVAPSTTLIELVRHGFLGQQAVGPDRLPLRMARLAAIAETVPAFRLRYANDYGQLEAVERAIKTMIGT